MIRIYVIRGAVSTGIVGKVVILSQLPPPPFFFLFEAIYSLLKRVHSCDLDVRTAGPLSPSTKHPKTETVLIFGGSNI